MPWVVPMFCSLWGKDMTMRLWTVLAVLIVTLAAEVAPASADPTDNGLPGAGFNVTLKPTPNGFEVSIVLPRESKFTDAKLSSTDPSVSALLDQRVDKEAQPSRAAEPTKSGDASQPTKPPPAYVTLVTVLLKTAKIRQGAYPLTLTAVGGSGPVIRDLWLVVPAAKIDPIDTLVVVNERGGQIKANQPQIWESSQRAWLTNITLDQKNDTTSNGDPAGRIKAKAKLEDIPPGRSELIEFDKAYVLDGTFPLGKVTGKLVLQADQFAAPVLFNFEVQTRIFPYSIFVPIAVGLFFGWLARKWLTQKQQLNQEKQKTYALVAMIDEALQHNEDHTFVEAARAAREQAIRAATRPTADEVKTETSAAQTVFQTALVELNTRRGSLDQRIAAFRVTLSAGYRLPSPLANEVTETRTLLEVGLPELDRNNVAVAEGKLDSVRETLAKVAVHEARQWLAGADSFDSAIDVLAPLLGAQATDFKTRSKAFRDSLSLAVRQLEDDPTDSLDKLKAVLDSLHAAVYALENLQANVATVIERQVSRWIAVLTGANLPQREAWQRWADEAKGFAKTIRETPAADVGNPRGQADSSATTLLAHFREALLSQAAAQTERAEVEPLIKADKYSEAVDKVADHNSPVSAAEVRDMGSRGPVRAAAEAALDMVYFAPPNVPTPSIVYGFSAPPPGAVIPVSVLAALSQRDLQVTSTLLSLIYAALIAVAGYFLFADKWIGTPLDFATVFFWAFATDVGADAATTAAKGLNKS
jgi:hypothetical protein